MTRDDASRPAPAPLSTGLAAPDALDEAQVRERLSAASLEILLPRLGITGEDRSELEAVVPRALEEAAILTAVTRTANLLRTAGLEATAAPLGELAAAHSALQERILPGEGLVAILAHIASTDVVRAWHVERGLTEEQSWQVLADLGQQMRVHRASTGGRLGLHQVAWTAMNWCGRLVHLGRLQFDLHRSSADGRHLIGVHIPATGPLDPGEVEASFEQAERYFPAAYPDLVRAAPESMPAFGREFTCESWLMNRVLVDELGADSNIGAFVDRFTVVDSHADDEGAAFFVFHARSSAEAIRRPRRTRLEKVVGDRLADGRGWRTGHGVLVR